MIHDINASFSLHDYLNPGCGYQVRIENARTGETLLHTGRHPVTGEDLLTAADCLEVIGYYVAPGSIQHDTRCSVCEEIIRAGTPKSGVADYDNLDADLIIESTDTAHRDCAKATGEKRWRYYE